VERLLKRELFGLCLIPTVISLYLLYFRRWKTDSGAYLFVGSLGLLNVVALHKTHHSISTGSGYKWWRSLRVAGYFMLWIGIFLSALPDEIGFTNVLLFSSVTLLIVSFVLNEVSLLRGVPGGFHEGWRPMTVQLFRVFLIWQAIGAALFVSGTSLYMVGVVVLLPGSIAALLLLGPFALMGTSWVPVAVAVPVNFLFWMSIGVSTKMLGRCTQ
jgi:hypothetical protein